MPLTRSKKNTILKKRSFYKPPPFYKPGARGAFFFLSSLRCLLHPLIEQQVRTLLPPTDRPAFPTLGLVHGNNHIVFPHLAYIFVVKV